MPSYEDLPPMERVKACEDAQDDLRKLCWDARAAQAIALRGYDDPTIDDHAGHAQEVAALDKSSAFKAALEAKIGIPWAEIQEAIEG